MSIVPATQVIVIPLNGVDGLDEAKLMPCPKLNPTALGGNPLNATPPNTVQLPTAGSVCIEIKKA